MSAGYKETIANQRLAATPTGSAFVSANAGSGKTRVLTDRVGRLLLAGVAPAKILCITFTKAAAAEMADRLFTLLGKWALADDDALRKDLNELEGVDKKRSSAELANARKLFAQALETPGGLKIQTIHSFCESVLKRFPLEAGVAPGFTVFEETASVHLVNQTIEQTILNHSSATLSAAFTRLNRRYAPAALQDLISHTLISRQSLLRTLESAGGWDGLVKKLPALLEVDPAETEDTILAKAIRSIDKNLLERTKEIFAQGAKTAKGQAEGALSTFLTATSDHEAFTALKSFFLTTAGTPRAKFGDAQTKKIDPSLSDKLVDQQGRFAEQIEQVKRVTAYLDTAAFFDIVETTHAQYENLKASIGGLDYDDLIDATRHLFLNTEKNAWVMFKLDHGIDHILLDEAQDTSPSQWDIVEGPLKEFFAGENAHEANRTFFVVGDQKQSIYSFQGADAGLFKGKQLDLGKQIGAVAKFASVPLTLSFRTTAPVLNFVDALFADEQTREGLTDEELRHRIFREGEAGQVELWPLVPKPEKQELRAWDAPIDARLANNPAEILCDHVAQTIKNWIGTEILKSKGRPITPSDIIILVQRRSSLFHRMIAALAKIGVPVAGADRLKLLEDPAVEDLIAYGRCVLASDDDLSLAEILKSPFFNLDDQSLFDLAYSRRGSLWGALRKRSGERAEWQRALDEITQAQFVALKEGAYAFFCHILDHGDPSGRKRLFSRLSESSRQPIDELLRQALDFEQNNPRSLQAFVSWAENNAGEIKRDADQHHDNVRVMTVHGAKGLEGEIVFLLDAHLLPNTKQLGPIYYCDPGAPIHSAHERLPILSKSNDDHPNIVDSARIREKQEKFEEYRRLLYVAATRAKDRLYICGLEAGRRKDPEKTPLAEMAWYDLCEIAFSKMANVTRTTNESWAGEILQLACPQEKPIDEPQAPEVIEQIDRPGWLFDPAPKISGQRMIAPSALATDAEANSEPPALSPTGTKDKYFRGRILHRLLEILPDLPSDQRDQAADKLLSTLARDIAVEERDRWRTEILSVINDPEFAAAFGPGSRAEVSLLGTPKGAREDLVISGQIDRLVVEPDRILVIDYKTNRPPPKKVEDIADSYLAQMAAYRGLLAEIYPDRKIESALLWTFEARLTPLPSDTLDHAFARFLK